MGSERIVKEILTEKGAGASPDKVRGREGKTDQGPPKQRIACVKILRGKEHDGCRDHGRLTHNKHGTAEMAGDWS